MSATGARRMAAAAADMTVAREDPRLAEARALPLREIADSLGLQLRRQGGEMVGPCPACGGTDRFAISLPKNVWNCRRCARGGDAIALVMLATGCDFRAALERLCGPPGSLAPDPAELARRQAKAEASRRQREREAEKYRRAALDAARAIWRQSRPLGEVAAGCGPVAYLALRGIDLRAPADGATPPLPACLRYHAELPYMVQDATARREWREVWRGPAMVAAVQGPDDRLCAVHRTWFDLDRPRGKARILDGDRELKSKESRGSIKGGSIRLWTPRGATVMAMGEGIETTYTAWMAGARDWAYWAGVSLGNMAGRRLSGEGRRFMGLPDLTDRAAFVPPPWVRRLVLIQDGDSEARSTRAQLLACARRAMALRPGLTAAIVHAGEGRDLNDIVMEIAA